MTAFEVPDWIPAVPGLWAGDGSIFKSLDSRISGVRRVKTSRRRRLMACAFALRVEHHHKIVRPTVDVVMRFADGLATKDEVRIVKRNARHEGSIRWSTATWEETYALAAAEAVATAISETAAASAAWAAAEASTMVAATERLQQSRIYGLYAPCKFLSEWTTPEIARLADRLYRDQSPERPAIAAILAEMIQDRGYEGIWLRILRECPGVVQRGMTFIDKLRRID